MKRSFFIMTGLALMTAAQGKKVTIEGTSSSERMYLIVNEDTEHAQLLKQHHARLVSLLLS